MAEPFKVAVDQDIEICLSSYLPVPVSDPRFRAEFSLAHTARSKIEMASLINLFWMIEKGLFSWN